ncbi:immunity protein [Salmonella enterica subsp. enterica serovar Bovismorbificans]|uniref:Immunity protein n=1 Tax=Salmonella muenchen TaxID=596 RepID=A0A8E7P3X8_SALMU|nr:immunity protein [Salmonella enterica subsp. enterica serovar Muenchen]EAM8426893.1 immunity protein [Salmonella enterica]EHM2348346.1 immunity protein [Salmonella enterica subsp. enterica serovar Bovismorbificans]EAX0682369.1 immunity protein [Salmonella enterica]EAX4790509.1 immunity protein [Salmonella enterica]
MLDLESIYKNESVEDVLLHFALRTPYQAIDRMYVNYKFEVVANGELLKTHQKLFKEGKLKKTGKPLPEKGPNWKEPRFVTEKKYGIE